MPRALIVDDDPQTEHLFQTFFPEDDNASNGCTFAASDDAALEIIRSGANFDIAFIAIDRTPISGMSLFHQIKDRTFRVPRIALTSSGTDLSLIRAAMNQGAADFLVKPISNNEFSITLTRVLETVERRRRNWDERAQFSALKREVDIAADIQQKILPSDFPAVDGYEFSAQMHSAKSMGGDFYDIFQLPDNRTGCIVADVSGKGVPAAFYMAVARTLIRSVAMSPDDVTPAQCLHQVNDLLCAHHISGMFVSVFYAILDPAKHAVHFANGGHQLPFLGGVGTNPIELEGGHGPVLGIIEDMVYEESSVSLDAGDYLYIYTDGVSEAFNVSRQAFGEDGIRRALAGMDITSAPEVIDTLDQAIAAFVGDADQHDDITSMVVRRARLRIPQKSDRR